MAHKFVVYFIQSGKKGAIKIGHTRNIEKRIAELQIGNPYELFLLCTIEVDGLAKTRKLERYLHRRFSQQHIRGEWFQKNIKLKEVLEEYGGK